MVQPKPDPYPPLLNPPTEPRPNYPLPHPPAYQVSLWPLLLLYFTCQIGREKSCRMSSGQTQQTNRDVTNCTDFVSSLQRAEMKRDTSVALIGWRKLVIIMSAHQIWWVQEIHGGRTEESAYCRGRQWGQRASVWLWASSAVWFAEH